MICVPVSGRPIAITYLNNQKGMNEVIIYQKEKEGEVISYQKDGEAITYQKQKEKEDEIISYQNNNMEDEDTKYVVSKFTNPP